MEDLIITVPDEPTAAAPEIVDADEAVSPAAVAPAADAAPVPKGCVLCADGSLKVPLRYPVALKWRQGDRVREDTYTELHLQRLNGEHVMRINEAAAGLDRAVVSLSCATRLPHSVAGALFKRLDAADIVRVSGALSFLLGTGP